MLHEYFIDQAVANISSKLVDHLYDIAVIEFAEEVEQQIQEDIRNVLGLDSQSIGHKHANADKLFRDQYNKRVETVLNSIEATPQSYWTQFNSAAMQQIAGSRVAIKTAKQFYEDMRTRPSETTTKKSSLISRMKNVSTPQTNALAGGTGTGLSTFTSKQPAKVTEAQHGGVLPSTISTAPISQSTTSAPVGVSRINAQTEPVLHPEKTELSRADSMGSWFLGSPGRVSTPAVDIPINHPHFHIMSGSDSNTFGASMTQLAAQWAPSSTHGATSVQSSTSVSQDSANNSTTETVSKREETFDPFALAQQRLQETQKKAEEQERRWAEHRKKTHEETQELAEELRNQNEERQRLQDERAAETERRKAEARAAREAAVASMQQRLGPESSEDDEDEDDDMGGLGGLEGMSGF